MKSHDEFRKHGIIHRFSILVAFLQLLRNLSPYSTANVYLKINRTSSSLSSSRFIYLTARRVPLHFEWRKYVLVDIIRRRNTPISSISSESSRALHVTQKAHNSETSNAALARFAMQIANTFPTPNDINPPPYQNLRRFLPTAINRAAISNESKTRPTKRLKKNFMKSSSSKFYICVFAASRFCDSLQAGRKEQS